MTTDFHVRMQKLIIELNQATTAYDKGKPYMTDEEWDNKYFELQELEEQNHFSYLNSPTHFVFFSDSVSELKKIKHSHDMLSLAKTKRISDIERFFGADIGKDFEALAMLKLDGLTISLTYKNGKLVLAETRGNGSIGEDVTHNAMVIPSIPKYITTTEPEIIIDGEIICRLNDFEAFSSDYANARNFAAGSIRLLDPQECKNRCLTFVAWEVIKGYDNITYLSDKLNLLVKFGFSIVPYVKTSRSFLAVIDDLKKKSVLLKLPIDGVVFKYDDVAYGRSLGQTAHHFKNAIAFKFYDELYETTLQDIEWHLGRQGQLVPVGVFTPVEIDGSIVERASLHNVNILTQTLKGTGFKGEKIQVTKSNMVIPQIMSGQLEWHKQEDEFLLPTHCPFCGKAIAIKKSETGHDNIYCVNNRCDGVLINRLVHFCSKKGLDINGLSEITLTKLIEYGWIRNLSDIFLLKGHKKEWSQKKGFGEKSVEKILDNIEKARLCTLDKFIAALGIPTVGITVAKELAKHFGTWENFRASIDNDYDFTKIPGFAEGKKEAIRNFNYKEADSIYIFLTIGEYSEEFLSEKLRGQKYAITGQLKLFKNRIELADIIERHGGRVAKSVTKDVVALITDNPNSLSSKAVTARKYNIPIISESDFLKKI